MTVSFLFLAVPVPEHKKSTDYVSDLFRVETALQPRPRPRLSIEEPTLLEDNEPEDAKKWVKPEIELFTRGYETATADLELWQKQSPKLRNAEHHDNFQPKNRQRGDFQIPPSARHSLPLNRVYKRSHTRVARRQI